MDMQINSRWVSKGTYEHKFSCDKTIPSGKVIEVSLKLPSKRNHPTKSMVSIAKAELEAHIGEPDG